MDRKKGILNISVSIGFKLFILIANILVRRFLIQYIGNEVNGLNSLYLSILDFLSVAELGVGTAITFCMYKPIVDGDNVKVSALYNLFTKLYLIIGAVILAGGCIVMPFLPHLAKDYQSIDVNLYLTFGLMLASVVLTYAYSSKTSLINAYKNNYITTAISSGGLLLKCGLQIVVLILTRSFIWFLICRLISVALQWIITEIYARVRFKGIIGVKAAVDAETKKDVTKNVKAMFMHKIGSVLVNTADSVIISALIGVVILGKYSNYTTVMLAMTGVINLFFTPLTSVIGHMCVDDNKTEIKKYYNFFHAFNFVLGLIFFLGYYAIIDNVVTICFGEGLILEKTVSYVITLNYFIQFMRQATLLFRDATGTFYYDRWKPLIEGIINVVMSVAFVFIFPEEYKVVGVIVATILTNLFICHIIEPYVLYKHAFKASVKKYYLINYVYIAVFACALTALHFCMRETGSHWTALLINGFISVGISAVICVLVLILNKNFRHYVKVVLHKFKKKEK